MAASWFPDISSIVAGIKVAWGLGGGSMVSTPLYLFGVCVSLSWSGCQGCVFAYVLLLALCSHLMKQVLRSKTTCLDRWRIALTCLFDTWMKNVR